MRQGGLISYFNEGTACPSFLSMLFAPSFSLKSLGFAPGAIVKYYFSIRSLIRPFSGQRCGLILSDEERDSQEVCEGDRKSKIFEAAIETLAFVSGFFPLQYPASRFGSHHRGARRQSPFIG